MLVAANPAPAAHQATPLFPSCPPIAIVGARGSGTQADDAANWGGGLGLPAQSFAQTIQATYPDAQIGYVPYPAVSILNANGIGAGLRQKWIGDYDNSVARGKELLREIIESEVAACPATQIMLAGYSQGAQVVGDVFQELSPGIRSHINSVALWGDPKYHNDPNASFNHALTNQGVLGTRTAFPMDPSAVDSSGRSKVRTYCHPTDPVCQGASQLLKHGKSGHFGYEKVEARTAAFATIVANRATLDAAVASFHAREAPSSGKSADSGATAPIRSLTGLSWTAIGGWRAGSTVSFAFAAAVKGRRAVPHVLLAVIVRTPAGSEVVLKCAGTADLAPAASRTCKTSRAFGAPGRYFVWAAWSNSGQWHAVTDRRYFTLLPR